MEIYSRWLCATLLVTLLQVQHDAQFSVHILGSRSSPRYTMPKISKTTQLSDSGSLENGSVLQALATVTAVCDANINSTQSDCECSVCLALGDGRLS